MEGKIRLAVFGQKRLSREGGIEIVVKELCTRMAQNGCDITCYNRAGHHVSGAEYDKTIEYDGIRQKVVPTIEKKGLAAVSSSFFAALCSAFGRYDVVHEPFGFSLLLSFLAMFFYLYAYESIGAGKGWKIAIMTWYQKFKESVFFRKLFFLAFVTSLILFRTLLNRQLWMNPLSDVMGGWGIWETVNGEQKLTTECIENVIMMVPFSAVVMWTFEEKIGNSLKKILWQSGKIAFIFSISIEMLQLLLRLGTFQLSDIFYNTVGGMIGGLMYCAVMKVRKRL